MSRSLVSRLLVAGAFVLSAGALTMGCSNDLDPPTAAAKPDALPPDTPLCRARELRGVQAEIFDVKASGGLLAAVSLDLNEDVLCVDDAQGIVDTGLVPVVPPDAAAKPAPCNCFDGTPLPASIILSRAMGQ